MKVLVAGDFCPTKRVAEKFDKGDCQSVLGDVKTILSNADYSIVNFECPITKGNEKPIVKQGPNLQCSENGVEAVKWTGFNCVTLANNHFRDYGDQGVKNTLKVCIKNGLDYVGGGENLSEASRILYKEKNGETLAIINCCEHEFSIATNTTAGSNPLNPIQQFYELKEARKKADYVMVIVHGGHELWQLPSPRMVETYRFFVDAGADAVVNHHQHCFSGYEVYHGKPIIYGLGNFCFDKPGYFSDLWSYGYMVNINFSTQISFEILPYEQCRNEPKVKLLEDKHGFEGQLKELNSIISNEKLLAEATLLYYQKSAKITELVLEPYRGRLLSKLFLMGWLPKLIKKGKLTKLQNMMMCEAHRDKLMYVINNVNR